MYELITDIPLPSCASTHPAGVAYPNGTHCLSICARALLRLLTIAYAFELSFLLPTSQCFEPGKIGTTRYHKLVVTKPEVRHFVDWLEEGLFDALEKGYLDVVLLEVFARDPRKSNSNSRRGAKKSHVLGRGELLECFSFIVTYGKDGAQLKLSGRGNNGATSCPSGSKDEIKKSTSLVLRSLVELTETLQPLPKNRILSLKVRAHLFFAITPILANRLDSDTLPFRTSVALQAAHAREVRAAPVQQGTRGGQLLVPGESVTRIGGRGDDAVSPAEHEHPCEVDGGKH